MKNEMRLQGVGLVEGTPAKEIKVGDYLMWNFGSKSEVLAIKFSKTGKTLVATLKSYDTCNKIFKTSERKMTAERLVCIRKVA